MNKFRILLGLVIILLGISMLFGVNLLRYVFPLLLIWIGFYIISGKQGLPTFSSQEKSEEDQLNRVLIFSRINQRVLSDNFKKAEVVAIFGGGEIDLSQVKTKQEQVNLELVTVFGNLEIILPPEWQTQADGVGILGNFSSQAAAEKPIKTKAKIEGVAVFGRVLIKN